MQKKIILPNTKDLDTLSKYTNSFILPLEDYAIGQDIYFTLDEINSFSDKYEIYILINKFMHLKIYEFKTLYPQFNKNIKFIIEDIGLTSIIDKDRLVLYENHILSNYKAINFLKEQNINNVVINNDLTIDELKEIMSKTTSNIYYFYISKNMIMYSRRNLVKNYNDHFHLPNVNEYLLDEKVTHHKLEIYDEKDGSTVRNHQIFCASKYLDDLQMNLIIDLSKIDEINTKMILENIDSNNLHNLIDSDYYFLENDIKYKVGDLK